MTATRIAASTGAWLPCFVLLLGACTATLAAEPADSRFGRHLLLAHATEHDAHAEHRSEATSRRKLERSIHTYKIPDVTLLDMTGAKVQLAAALGEEAPLLLNFIFTSCTSICPLMSVTFSEVQRRLGAEGHHVRMVSISIDPEHDSPAQLSAFATRHDAGPGWQFLTGRTADIEAVQRAFDAYRGNKMSHVPATYIRTALGGQWVRLDGMASAGELVAEYRRAVRK